MDRRKLLLGFLAVPIAALAKRIPAGPDFACGGLLSPGMAVGTYTPETIIPRKLADEIFVRDESTCYYPDGRSVRYAYSYQLDSHGYPMNLTPHRIAPDGTITFSPLQAGKEGANCCGSLAGCEPGVCSDLSRRDKPSIAAAHR